MTSNYEDRAKKFIRDILPFLDDMNDPDMVNDNVYEFNCIKHRKVQVFHGAARIALISSDYVVKYTYDDYNADRFGDGEDEIKFYQYAKNNGFEYLLAKVSRYCYAGKIFYIMPRINNIDSDNYYDAYYYMTDEEFCFFKPCLYDLHSGNYGWKNGHVVIIDYACYNPAILN